MDLKVDLVQQVPGAFRELRPQPFFPLLGMVHGAKVRASKAEWPGEIIIHVVPGLSRPACLVAGLSGEEIIFSYAFFDQLLHHMSSQDKAHSVGGSLGI